MSDAPNHGDSTDSMGSPSNADRIRAYKNNSLDQNELRRRREEEGIQLRKQKREDLLRKRRNLNCGIESDISMTVNATVGTDTEKFMNTDIIQDSSISSNTVGLTALDKKIISGLYVADDKDVWLTSTRAVRHILSKSTTAPIEEVISTGMVPRLVEFLDHADVPELQFEATWCLTNISSGDVQQTRTVVDAQAVPKLIKLLDSPSHLVREQAVWTMGNIAGNGPSERDVLLRIRCVDPLIKLACNESATPQMLRNISWCIVNLVRYKNPPAPFDVLSPFIPCLSKFLNSADPDVLIDACWALAHLANGSNEQIQEVLNANVCPRLVQLLLYPQLDVCVGALRAVGNLVTGYDKQTQVVLDSGVLPCLRALLESGHPCCHKEVCWSLSNITAGSSSQVQQTMEAGLFSVLVKMMSHNDFKLRKEAAWSIVNACLGGSPEHIHALVADGCLPPLCKLLSVDDVPAVSMALGGIEAILRVGEQHSRGPENEFALKIEECGGLDRIEFLQMHPSVEIYKRVYNIIDRYFGHSDEVDSTVSPLETGHFEFTASATAKVFNL